MGQLPKRKWDLVAVERATSQQRSYVAHSRKVVEDAKREERLQRQECQVCILSGKIGGAVCTSRECGLCDKILHSGNTCVDVLCVECAKRNNLCKHCGATLDLRNRRKPLQ